MTGGRLSLILLPTLRCNAACDYCFESKSRDRLTLDSLKVLVGKVLDYMDEKEIAGATFYWQGGEVMTLSPDWLLRARDVIGELALKAGKEVAHGLQSNLVAYHGGWDRVLHEMFGSSTGTSMDFPNRYRKLQSGSPQDYERLWRRKAKEAMEAGVQVGVIAVANEETLKQGAARFYSYFVEAAGVADFQVNTPFPGGEPTDSKKEFPLNPEDLIRFFKDLADIWMERGFSRGIRVGPLDHLLDYFLDEPHVMPCIWQENCAREFVCVDPRGNVAQCDCWVASYPDFHFGNLFREESLGELLDKSPVRRRFLERPGRLARDDVCLDCSWLGLCHGGCPVRAYTVHGDLHRRDPYCGVYCALFEHMEQWAARWASRRREVD